MTLREFLQAVLLRAALARGGQGPTRSTAQFELRTR